jgi:uncharacterized delta-60 repeat protein
MRGSVLVTFDEFINDRGVDAVVLYVNNVVRKVQNTDINNLWTVPINTGDVVKVEVVFSGDYNIDIGVNRTDYTTDDSDRDFGIKNTYITGITGATAPPFYVEFTATTRPDSYSYRYVVNCSTNANCLNIGIGFNQGITPASSYAVREVKLINGKIYCMGNFGQYQGVPSNSFIVLENDGSIDPTFPLNVMSTNSVLGSIEQQSDGKVLLGGSFGTYSGVTKGGIVRINNDYSIDNTFVTGTGFGFAVFDLEIQPDGKILAGGSFTSYNGTTIRNMCRLNSNGSLDTSFSGNTNTLGGGMIINDISLYPDGKMLIGGDFLNYNNVSTADKIIRLNSNGSIDTSFTSPFVGPIGSASRVLTTEILSDGKIMIGGNFDFPISGSTSFGLARLNSDGSLDTTFTTDTYFDSETATDFYVLPNGKILMLVTGTDPEKDGLYRLNSDGSIDSTFNVVLFDQTFLYTQESIAVTGDGDIIVGGGFTTVNGNTYRRIFKCTEDGILLMCTDLEIQLMTELSESITAENEDNLIINL